MLIQPTGHALIIPIEDAHGDEFFGFATGLGLLSSNRGRGTDDMFGGIDDGLMTAVVVAQHHFRRAWRRELFGEFHEIRG